MSDIEMGQEKNGTYATVNLSDVSVLGVLGNARTYFQYKSMYDNFAANICPFCHLEKLKYPPVHHIGNWALKKNDMPYINSEHHLVIVYAGGHLTDWKKLTREEKADYWDMVDWAEEHFKIDGCGIATRRGNPARHAGSISHIHSHIQVVELASDGLPVGELVAYFAKSRNLLEHCQKMVGLFEKIRTGNEGSFSGLRRGLIVFREGLYLSSDTKSWLQYDRPNAAEIISLPVQEIAGAISDPNEVQAYEAMYTEETKQVLMDGPFPLEEYMQRASF